MINDYLVVDNILDDPDLLVDLSKRIEYYKRTNTINGALLKDSEPIGGYWQGLRSDLLEVIDYSLCNRLSNEIFKKITSYNVECRIESYLHFAPAFVGQPQNSWWHKDDGSVLAGVIYLNTNPPKNSGTIVLVDNKPVVIDNVFNRLALYNANLLHRPEQCFGDDVNNARLTLTFFIKELTVLPL